MFFIHRKVPGDSVNLAGTGENYLNQRVHFSAGFKNGELSPTIDFQIGMRIKHRIQMTGLPGQIKKNILPLN